MTSYALKIRPFAVPQTITVELPTQPKENGFQTLPIIQISDLPRSTVLELCEEFQKTLLENYDRDQNRYVGGDENEYDQKDIIGIRGGF